MNSKVCINKQIQWSLDSDEEESVTINDGELSYGLAKLKGGLNCTQQRICTIILLLDKIDGRKWYVQWGMEYGNSNIRRYF